MEAKDIRKEIWEIVHIETISFTVIYKDEKSYNTKSPSCVSIQYDSELSDTDILMIVSYVQFTKCVYYHRFVTDKMYMTNITRYVHELIDNEIGGKDEN